MEGEEQVTVPAGTFAALKVSLQGPEQPLTIWISKEAPRQVVKIAFTGAPVEIVRVSPVSAGGSF